MEKADTDQQLISKSEATRMEQLTISRIEQLSDEKQEPLLLQPASIDSLLAHELDPKRALEVVDVARDLIERVLE